MREQQIGEEANAHAKPRKPAPEPWCEDEGEAKTEPRYERQMAGRFSSGQ